jgi:hypothetical protein
MPYAVRTYYRTVTYVAEQTGFDEIALARTFARVQLNDSTVALADIFEEDGGRLGKWLERVERY